MVGRSNPLTARAVVETYGTSTEQCCSMKARVLTLKLGFLCCLLSSEDNNIAIKNFPHSCHTGRVAQQHISLDSKRAGMQFDYMLNNTDHLIAML